MNNIYHAVAYSTIWRQIKKDGSLRKGVYTTKQKTAYHDKLHEMCDMAQSGPILDGPIPLHEIQRSTSTDKYKKWLLKK